MSAVKIWERTLQRVFEVAEIPDGTIHRFRDTFAVELLLKGVPIEQVSVLLGHSSLRITENTIRPGSRHGRSSWKPRCERPGDLSERNSTRARPQTPNGSTRHRMNNPHPAAVEVNCIGRRSLSE
jgi:integrase